MRDEQPTRLDSFVFLVLLGLNFYLLYLLVFKVLL
jgi:hypothetical protein